MLKFKETPWPHFVGSLPKTFYNHVKDNWNTNEEDKQWNKIKNRSDIFVKDDKINTVLSEVILGAFNKSKDIYKKFYPRFDADRVWLNTQHSFAENPLTDKGFPMRKLHMDNGNKLVTGLWYFKNENEEDDGGHLTLHNPITKEEEEFRYKENSILLFPNTPISWHYITDRKSSKYPRRFICMRAEAKIKLHNYQTKNGKDVLKYEDIINNYE